MARRMVSIILNDKQAPPPYIRSMSETSTITACVLLIGDEILSGRTQDKNLAHIATALADVGVEVREAHIIPDTRQVIIDSVNGLRQRFDYVFTTGGIGPTHDDITAACIAEAFGVPLEIHPLAHQSLQEHYDRLGASFNEARQRMARIPHGATLIDNPISSAPGFAIGNVYVMAGIPRIMQAMLENVLPSLRGGEKIASITITAAIPEGTIAAAMTQLQEAHPEISIGLYPFYGPKGAGVSVVARGRDMAALAMIETAVRGHLAQIGAELIDRPPPLE